MGSLDTPNCSWIEAKHEFLPLTFSATQRGSGPGRRRAIPSPRRSNSKTLVYLQGGLIGHRAPIGNDLCLIEADVDVHIKKVEKGRHSAYL